MKFAIVMLYMVVSANVFAFGENKISVSTNFSLLGTMISTSGPAGHKVQAEAVLNDAQEMLQTGSVSLFLSQKIQEVQNENDGISESEALDILIEASQVALAN